MMPPSSSHKILPSKVFAFHRQARHHYTILETFEAGLVLKGSEVKSIRTRGVQLTEAYIDARNGELFLRNAHIASYGALPLYDHPSLRDRKLLLRRRQIQKCAGSVQRKGLALIPLKLYQSPRGWIKLEFGLCQGKKEIDKREALKEKEWNRQKQRILKQNLVS